MPFSNRGGRVHWYMKQKPIGCLLGCFQLEAAKPPFCRFPDLETRHLYMTQKPMSRCVWLCILLYRCHCFWAGISCGSGSSSAGRCWFGVVSFADWCVSRLVGSSLLRLEVLAFISFNYGFLAPMEPPLKGAAQKHASHKTYGERV